MKTPACVAFVCCLSACHSPQDLHATPGAMGFDGDVSGWVAANTGGSGPVATWQARADADAISAPNVIALVATNHTAEDRFNLFWTAGALVDGRIAVAMRADEGEVDQGGGVIWRVQDANNYYVCRFNPLESNFRVYVVKDGVRRQLASAVVEGAASGWHRLEATFAGERITCSFDGRPLLEASDATIRMGGGHGLWTKADARSSFDDLVVQAKK